MRSTIAVCLLPALGLLTLGQTERVEASVSSQPQGEAAPATGSDSQETNQISGEAESPTVPPEASEVDEDSGTEEDEEEEPFATLVLSADAACYVYINGELKGEVGPEAPGEIEVDTAVVAVLASSTEVSGASYELKEKEMLVLEEGERRELALPMLEAIEELRKTERRERVWRDLDRGLMWARNDNAADVTWSKAGLYCEELETGGYTNWRLPAIAELESIEAKWSMRPFKTVDPIYMSACCAWSTTQASGTTAYNVDFRYRRRFETNRGLSYNMRALCVRDMLAPEMADALLAADPKEQKRRLKEKRKRMDERKRRKAERAAEKAAREAAKNPDGG